MREIPIPRFPSQAKLLWAIPFAVSASLSFLCLCTLSNYLFADAVADLCHTRWYPLERDHIGRPPGFPAFLELWAFLVPKPELRLPAFSVFQHLLILVDILLIQLFFRDRSQPVLAWVASLCWAVEARNHILAHTTQTEPLFITLSLLWIWSTHRWLLGRGRAWAITAGLTLGGLVALRTIGIIAVPLLLTALLLVPRRWRWRELALYTVVTAAVISGFLLRNHILFGRAVLDESAGCHLLHGVVYHFDELPDAPACNKITGFASNRDYELFGRDTLWDFRKLLSDKKKLSHQEVDALLKRAAVEAILDRPLDYLLASVGGVFHATDFVDPVFSIAVGMNDDYFPWHARWYESECSPEVVELAEKFPIREQKPIFGDFSYRILQEFTTTHASNLWRGWWVFPAMVPIGILALWRRDPGLILCAGFAIATVWLASLTEAPQRRFYQVGVAPFMLSFWMMAALARARIGRILEKGQ